MSPKATQQSRICLTTNSTRVVKKKSFSMKLRGAFGACMYVRRRHTVIQKSSHFVQKKVCGVHTDDDHGHGANSYNWIEYQ